MITLSGVEKSHGGRTLFSDVSLQMNRGDRLGLVGPNGAGKTTCIRIFLDFIRPTSGSAKVLGMDSRSESLEIRRNTGYLPGDFITYEKLTAEELQQ